jgi:hypothetical protein
MAQLDSECSGGLEEVEASQDSEKLFVQLTDSIEIEMANKSLSTDIMSTMTSEDNR